MLLAEPPLPTPVAHGRSTYPVDSAGGTVDSTAQRRRRDLLESRGYRVIPWTLPAHFNKKSK